MKFVKEDYHDRVKKRNQAIAALCGIALCILLYILFFHNAGSPDTENILRPDSIKLDANAFNQKETSRKRKKGEVMDIPALFAMAKKSVVIIKTYNPQKKGMGQGTGFFIDRSGILISNRHVFKGANSAEALGELHRFPIKRILAESSKYDLVKLEVSSTDESSSRIIPLTLNNSLPEVGEKVLVVGNPMGLDFTISDGIVSGIREVQGYGRVIQITSPISPGSSGSPVFNMQGEVIGVATFQMRSGQNLNFAIPIARIGILKEVNSEDLATINFEDSHLVSGEGSWFEKGMILFSRDEFAGGIRFFEKAVEEDPQNSEAYMHLGICYRNARATNAVSAFKSAIQINPDYAEAYFELGVTYIEMNMAREAIRALRTATELKAGYDEALLNLGIAYNMNKEYSFSKSVLKQSLDIYPDAKGYYYLGSSYYELKQYDRAIGAFREAIEMDNKMVPAYQGLGASYASVQNWKRGIEILNQAVILEPNNPAVHYLLGIMHLGNNDLESAQLESTVLSNLKDAHKYRNELSSAISRYRRGRR